MSCTDLIENLKNTKKELEQLEDFIKCDLKKSEKFKGTVKKLYDFIRKTEDSSDTNVDSLPELIVSDVDNEQIYQQLQLHNGSEFNSLMKYFSKCLVGSKPLTFNVNTNESSAEEEMTKKALKKAAERNRESSDDEMDENGFGGEDDDDSDAAIVEVNPQARKKPEVKQSVSLGIPDGSDSEISDFEVGDGENGEGDDDAQGDNNEEDEDDDDMDDLEIDEMDGDIAGIFGDLGDEKEILEIGKNKPYRDDLDADDDEDGDGMDGEDDYGEDDEEGGKNSDKNGAKDRKKNLFDMGKDDEGNDEGKSSFEKRQAKLKENAEKIHEAMLNDVGAKPWQLKGEVTAKTRPQDSLLEEFLQFDHTTRQAPSSSVDMTVKIEEMLKQRIKDKTFDDVERKVKPVEMQYEYKKQVTLDHEKSKMSLSQIYEKEYLDKTAEAQSGEKADDKPNPKHDEIKSMLQSLFIKLDALSNFHYTPKAPAPEVKIVSNMPTIRVEEVAPVTMSEANMMAPEEIHAKIEALPKGSTEEDKKDKKKKLKKKKLVVKKKKERKEKLLQLKQALNPDDAKLNKQVAMAKLEKQSKNMSKNIKILKQDKSKKLDSSLKSSSEFFKQMNDLSATNKTRKTKNKSKDSSDHKSSKKLKL